MLRKFGLLSAFGALCFVVSPLSAADDATKPRPKPGEARKAGDGPRAAEFLKKFDKDGDGKLSDAERAEAMKSRGGPGGRPDPARMQELVKKFDKDGDGKLSETEREAARAEMAKNRPAGGRPDAAKMQEIIKKFDKDGDGKLNDAEREAARAEMGKNRPAGKRPEGKRPEGKPAPKPEKK